MEISLIKLLFNWIVSSAVAILLILAFGITSFLGAFLMGFGCAMVAAILNPPFNSYRRY